MKNITAFFILFFFYSCNKKAEVFIPNFTDFIFVDLNLQENTSIKFTGKDTLYIQKRMPDLPLENYILILNEQDRDSLISRINKLNLEEKQSIYAQTESDSSQVFILNKHEKTKSVSIIGKSGPTEVNSFGDWISKFEAKQKRIKTKENIHFWNLKNTVPPPWPPSKIKHITFKKS
ncbi:hypothetical protein [Flavobacterium pectinovorum]|uniref:Lipoprotein n=1 Tax=Flavobacterium pectinovorum TaxID=29533 RepID=A0A502EWH7_9FLAO|nr:hypothetical protein [Flavobacterium pectinovorum]TPG42083.1 hypothetical protein EAH81_07105 [Flavobacterium pectinovorum]